MYRQDSWSIAGKRFNSRLLHCFGNATDKIDLKTAVGFINRTETDFLTVYTQGSLDDFKDADGDIKHWLKRKYTILVNTNHALSVEEAVKRGELGSRLLKSRWIKLEVLNKKLTRPMNKKTARAAKILLKKGYLVMPLMTANLKDALRFEKIGCSVVRVLLSDIGSEQGMKDEKLFRKICERVTIPVIAEGGIGGSEDAYKAMAVGASAVLVNKSLFSYQDPFLFVEALKSSIKGGRLTYLCNQQKY